MVLPAAAAMLLPALLSAASPRPRHAVILLIDDLGYGDTGHMGAEFATPAIDGLALGGIILNQASSAVHTCPPLLPCAAT